MKDLPFDLYDFFGYLSSGLLILYGLELIVGVPHIVGKDLKILDLTVVLLAAYIAGQLAATPAKALLETLVVGRVLGAPNVNLMNGSDRLSIFRLLFPEYFRPLPESVRTRILTKTKAEGLDAPGGEDLFLHIRFRDYIRNDATLMSRLGGFLNKYGFNRNLCFVALLFAAGVLSSTPFDPKTDATRYALLSGITGVFLFYRYLKFFRQYSYELFNAYAGKS